MPKIRKRLPAKKVAPHIKTAYGVYKTIKHFGGTVKSKKGASVDLTVQVGSKGTYELRGPQGEAVQIFAGGGQSKKDLTKAILRPAGTPCPMCHGTGRV